MPSRRRPLPSSRSNSQSHAKRKARHARPRSAVSRSLAAKSQKSRDAILRAAAALFRHQGYSGTTLRQIASLAKTKAGSIYYHFDSKEEILKEVLERGLQHVVESVKTAV